MNIWIFNHYAQPPDLPGGTRHYDLGRQLVKRGHRVVIFATSFHHYLHRETRLQRGEQWKVEDVDGIRFVWIRTPPYWRNDWRRVRNMAVFMLRAWRLGRKLPKQAPEVGKPDVVIGSSVHLLAVLAGYWVAAHFRARFVMEVRDLWPQAIVDLGRMRKYHPIIMILSALERFLYFRAERIIILGDYMEQHICSLGIDKTKLVWIPNGVDISRFADTGTHLRSSNDMRFRVMYLGAHSESNALHIIIHTARHVQARGHKNIRFILVGDGPTKQELIRLASSLGLKNVEFRDPVPKTEVPHTLEEADVLVLTKHPTFGRYSGSILKLFDYMAAAKPIVFSGKISYDPVSKSACGLTARPGDPQALAEAVIKLYQMPREEREAMGRRGREYVEKYHDIRKLAERLEKVLLEVTQSR